MKKKSTFLTDEDIQLLKKLIFAEFQKKTSNELIAIEAANCLFKIKQREKNNRLSLNSDCDDAVFGILHFPKLEKIKIFNSDIRGLIIRNSLISLIREASCFSKSVLEKQLGDKLLRYIKQAGFADYRKETILLIVNSTSVAHEMYFYKAEILERLRNIKEFSKLKYVKFVIQHNSKF